MELRKDIQTNLLDETYREEAEYIPKCKLPNGAFLISRMLHLCRNIPGRVPIKKEFASTMVARELREDWISKNIYPSDERTVAKAIVNEYKLFCELVKQQNRTDRPPPKDWNFRASTFNVRMKKNAYDIRTQSNDYEKMLESNYKVKMTKEDELFWWDNCNGNYVAKCSSTIPRNWLKQMRRNENRAEAMDIKKLQNNVLDNPVFTDQDSFDDMDVNCDSDDATYIPKDTVRMDTEPLVTRSRIAEEFAGKKNKIPKVKIRTGFKSIEEKVMRCLVHCAANYNVSMNDLRGIFCQVGNDVFDQCWVLDSTDEASDATDSEEEKDEDEQPSKRRKKSNDYTYVIPTRKTISAYLEDAAMMNLKMVADELMKEDNVAVTVGLDDTTKAAGFHKYDVKTDHITIAKPDGTKSSFTTGYVENRSHSGKDGAEAYLMKLESLAILAGVSVDDIKAHIHFWMTDRAADCAVMLKELGVTEDQILKCSAHLLLCIDNSIDKTFRNTESLIGREWMINAAKILHNGSTSLHTTGLIALAKLVSPSHSSRTVSLYTEFKDFLEDKGLNAAAFHGFVSNRFGRTLELSNEFVKHKDTLLDYFDSTVDENANKLVLAVSTFLDNSWFLCCSEVYQLIGQMLITPLMYLIGVDRKAPSRCEWQQLKEFFERKLPELDNLQRDFAKTATGKGKLIGACLLEITDGLRRQLSAMQYFVPGGETGIDEERLRRAPIANLGCEGNFAWLDNRVRTNGGMTTIRTHSVKNIVAKNGLLVDKAFTELPEEEKTKFWNWARSSEEVRDVKALEKDFVESVKSTKLLSLHKKQQMKKNKAQRMLRVLETCKQHGGPVTEQNIELLQRLTEKQLISEITFLRMTVCPDIRQKRKIKTSTGNRVVTLPKSELISSIKQVIKPDGNDTSDLDELLNKVLGGSI